MGIDELKAVFKLGVDLGLFVENAILQKYIALLVKLPTIVADFAALAKAGEALAEYEAMTDAQAVELEAYVEGLIGTSPDLVESVILAVFKGLLGLHTIVGIIKK